LLAGKYRIENVIGEGAMGIVLAAQHELLEVPVAVKLLSPELVHHQGVVDRFLREARAVARLKSEHVARVMDVGKLESGQPFIVMELLEGEDLEHRLERGSQPIDEAVDCILQALEALAHAHAKGIVHRDLKPANLYADALPDGREIIKVLDFGIAKLTDIALRNDGKRSGALTGEHAALGSPSYMAPEQVRDARRIDERVDVWAIGTILYELLSARPAFDGQSVGEIFGAVLHSTPTPLRVLRPEVPVALEAAVSRCLAREPDARFQNVAELARAIEPFGSGAFSEHVDRIEKTLERAGKSSNPDGPLRHSQPDLSHISHPDLAHRSSTPPDARRGRRSPAAVSPGRVVLTRAEAERALLGGAETQVATASDEPRARRSTGARNLAIGAATGSLVVCAVAVVIALHVRRALPPETETQAASIAIPTTALSTTAIPTTATVIPPPATTTSSPGAVAPSSVPVSPSTAAPRARPAAGGAVRPASPSRPLPATAAPRSSSTGLPRILGSPD
jgi:serine/threonine-protein kinase